MTDPARQLAKIISDLNSRWQPHPAQQRILNAIFRDNKMVTMLECGRKFGKTELDAYFLWRLALTKPGEYYYFTPLQNQGREIVWANRRFKEFGPPQYVAGVHEAEMRITFTNGSFIKVDGSDNFDKYRGPNPSGAVYDEFRDFRPEFHLAFGPNLGPNSAQLLINGTPPEIDTEHYDAMIKECKTEDDSVYYNFPSSANPHLPDGWLESQKRKFINRGDLAAYMREYEAKRVKGGKNAYFPMLDAEIVERKHIRHTKHVRPHAEIMEEVWRDKKKLMWQVVCDPGSSTVFCVNFRAINPYTKKVYRLGEIYERELIATSTSRIVPRIRSMKEELCPKYEAYGIEWDQFYDEAATWFATEAEASFDETFVPTQKSKHSIDDGISLLQDQLAHHLTVFSDHCIDGVNEYLNFIRDPKTGKPHSGCARHFLDTDRYGNSLAVINLRPEPEPTPQDPDDRPRFKTPEQDLRDSREADDFTGLDDF